MTPLNHTNPCVSELRRVALRLSAFACAIACAQPGEADSPASQAWNAFQNGGNSVAADAKLATEWTSTQNVAWPELLTELADRLQNDDIVD